MFGRSRRIRNSLNAIITAFEKVLPDQIAEARDLLFHGEPGVALELICTCLHDREIAIDPRMYEMIDECRRLMEMDESTISFLKELLPNGTRRDTSMDQLGHGTELVNDFERYESMFRSGECADQVCRRAFADGIGKLQAVLMLRRVYGLSLDDAAKIVASCDGDTEGDSP